MNEINNILDPIQLIWNQDVELSESRYKNHMINASEVYKLCPRAHFLANKRESKFVMARVLGSANVITFKIGRDLEYFFRQQFVKGIGIQNVLGLFDGELRLGNRFTDSLDNFEEVQLIDKNYRIIGHCDWIYLDKNGKLTVLELKTISKNRFEEDLKRKDKHTGEIINDAIIENKLQGSSYVKMLSEDPRVKKLGLEVNPFCNIYYICKGFRFGAKGEKGNPMYKCFNVPFKDVKKQLQQQFKKAKTTINSIKKDTLPPREVCDSYLCSRAKECPYVAECFLRDD